MKRIYTLLLFAVAAFSVNAQTATFTPAKDNSIYSENSNSSGVGELYSGQTCFSSSRRALMQFDISSIPSNATVTSVSLTVNVTNVSGGAGINTYSIHALTTDFGEGTSNGGGTGAVAVAPDATWLDAMLGTSTWTTPGGDFVPTSLSAVSMGSVNGNQTFITELNFVNAVQAWVNAPASNFGLIMIGDESTACTARRFGSKDVGTAPVLSVTYTLPCNGPTAVCQDVSVYLDGAGTATIVGADIDGGSTDDCATGSLQLDASQTAFTCADAGAGGGGGLIITGTYDGPLPGGLPKGVELYAGSAIADLSTYGIGSANNGGGTDGEEYTFPAVSAAAGDFIYVTTDSAGFNSFFGFDADFIDGSMSINGDDAVELFQNGVVIDVFGDINMDGTGTAWDHLDGWAYRNDLQGANSGVFAPTNWSYSGVDAFDGQTTNATSPTPFPVGSYTAPGTGIAVTLTVTDGLGNTDMCTAFVSVLDTIGVMPDMATLADETAACEVVSLTAPTGTDNCAGPITATTTATFPITASGTTVVTWTYDDGNGNITTQDQNVIISDATAPVADVATLSDIVDDCEVTPTAPTATDNCAGVITGTTTTTFPITASTTITWTYTDPSGNSSTQDQVVTINALDLGVTIMAPSPTLSADATGGVTYQWIDCSDNSAIAGETSQTFTATVNGDYAVIIDNGSCSDTSDCQNVSIGGLDDLIDLGMTVSPNPSAGEFTVSFDNTVSGIVTIVDANGRLIQTQELNGNSLSVDLTSNQSGLYFMIVRTEEGISRERIVKK